jgi:hypothetical protein
MSKQLENLVKLEESVFEVKAKTTVLEGKMASLQSSAQDLESKNQALDKKLTTVITNVQNALKSLAEQNLALEQSVISLGKLITAFTKVLVDKSLIEDKQVMVELRLLDEKNEKDKIESLRASGLLEQSDTVSDDSLVVLKQEIELESGKDTVSDYRTVQVSDLPKEDDARSKIVGLKVGGSFEREFANKEKNHFTVLEIYSFKKQDELKQQ